MKRPQWSLRSFVTLLLIVTTLTTLFIVGSLILLLRLPMIEKEARTTVQRDVKELADRMELLLSGLEARLDIVRGTIARLPANERQAFLQESMEAVSAFKAVYLVSRQGKILAVGTSKDLVRHGREIHGVDLSANSLFQAVVISGQRCWSDSYLSFMSGSITVGLGLPAGADHILIAEVPPAYLLKAALIVFGERPSPLWIIDRRGEIVTSAGGASASGTVNMLGEPLLQAALRNAPLPETIRFKGKRYFAGLAYSQALNWYFVATVPTGLDNPLIRLTVLLVVSAFLVAIFIGAMLTPFWARQLLTPIGRIIDQAQQVAEGGESKDWPRGRIVELNNLATHLETMAAAIREREKRFFTIFNTSPTPMLVTETDDELTVTDVNASWCLLFGGTRETIKGRAGTEVAFWRSLTNWKSILLRAMKAPLQEEVWLIHADGHPLLCRMSTSPFALSGRTMIIWAFEDITEIRRMEKAVQKLNVELEERIAQRTEALSASNRELSQTLANLQIAQRELVRSEKMAALGSLVAGVAHELNTPIGNGLISITTLADQARAFQQGMKEGLRRSELEALLANIFQATDIAARNLHRAADLLTNFKQVAVDQTSYQRRAFALHDLVNEIVTTLRPSLKRTPFTIQAETREGLHMDSYPGPLGQVLSNLINNAVLHGFDGRAHGTIRIEAERDGTDHLILRVIDDGNGIPAAIIDRIFDPFVTTKMGRGGSGLGLHIAFNIVSTLLGGSLTVQSHENEGAAFTLRLPLTAPETAGEAALECGLPV